MLRKKKNQSYLRINSLMFVAYTRVPIEIKSVKVCFVLATGEQAECFAAHHTGQSVIAIGLWRGRMSSR